MKKCLFHFVALYFIIADPVIATSSKVHPPVKGQIVRIELPGDNRILSLAEVEVFEKGANVALGKEASQSSSVVLLGAAKLAVDGNTDGEWKNNSVTHTDPKDASNPWWEVDLGRMANIEDVVVHNRTDQGRERLDNFTFKILDTERNAILTRKNIAQDSKVSCFTVTSSPYFDKKPKVHPPVKGQIVRIELPGDDRILSLAEVQVLEGGANVALKKRASQSNSLKKSGKAQLAVDGNPDGEWKNGSVTHTESADNPWWEVDLGRIAHIENVIVHNRTNGMSGARLDNFTLKILDAERNVILMRENIAQDEIIKCFNFGSSSQNDAVQPVNPVAQSERYIVSSSEYSREEIMKSLKEVRKHYGIDRMSKRIKPLGELQATRIRGELVQWSGRRAVIETKDQGRVTLMLRPDTTPRPTKPGDPVDVFAQKLHVTINKRLGDAELLQMNQYFDVTMNVAEYVRCLNSGEALKGSKIEPRPSFEKGSTHPDIIKGSTHFDR